MIREDICYKKKRVTVKGLSMAYVESGQGDPIVFFHGNPTSSYLWRNIIPHVENIGHCIAPDLIGMGDSDKLQNSGPSNYGFFEHRKYLDTFLSELDLNENVVLVVHDWGSALGFDWANRHRDAVKGIVYMEAIVRQGSWKETREPLKSFLKIIRSPAGERMILNDNIFIEKLLSQMVIRKLTDKAIATYRRPFLEPGKSRRPTLSWPRQIVLDGEPPNVGETIRDYAVWLGCNLSPAPLKA